MTIESAVYVVMKNDLAYILSGILSMYEHQSTYGPNLPVRFLIYLAQEYQRVVEKAEKDMQTALNTAIDCCIENDILKEFLLRNRAEVLGMLLEEFDKEKYERTIRGEGREEGMKAGLICSIEIMQEVNASRDSAKRKLMEKFSFTEEEAEGKLLLYWK